MDGLSLTHPDELASALRAEGWAVIGPRDLLAWLGSTETALEPLRATWHDLPPDTHLRDGGHYRFRRHDCFLVDPVARVSSPAPRRAHFQPIEYNALHGGIERWFPPILPAVVDHPAWTTLLVALGAALAGLDPVPLWHVEAHQFRVDTTGGIGRPTPEGAHRDGVDFVVVLMLGRRDIKGGETRVFQAEGPHGVRFTLSEPWSALVLDDRRVIHETTPIQPTSEHGYRDTLVLTYRAAGFQGPG